MEKGPFAGARLNVYTLRHLPRQSAFSLLNLQVTELVALLLYVLPFRTFHHRSVILIIARIFTWLFSFLEKIFFTYRQVYNQELLNLTFRLIFRQDNMFVLREKLFYFRNISFKEEI